MTLKKRMIVSLLSLLYSSAAFAQLRTLPETRNAALRYWQAFAEIKDPPPQKTTLDLMEKTLKGEAAWNESQLAPVLDPNQNALGIFLRATSLPECDWGLEYRRGPEASIAIVPRASVMARLNSLQAMREMANGHKNEAVARWLAGIRFSQDLAHGASLIFAITARSALLTNLRALSTEVKSGHFNESQKKQIFTAVKALPEDGFDWSTTWGIEEAGIEQFGQQLQVSDNPASLYDRYFGESSSKTCVPPVAKDIRALREYMDAVQAALRDSPANTRSRLDTLESVRKKLCPDMEVGIPSPERINDARIEIKTVRDNLLQALQPK
jgi:hypothetical protein